MPIPATTGVLQDKIEDMKIGDYIKVGYETSSSPLGLNKGSKELPINGLAWGTPIEDYFFYFIKVSKGLLIADRITSQKVSWDTLNTNRYIQGFITTIGGVSGVIRSLTGGVAFADSNGNMSSTDLNIDLAFPNNSEFDKYILKFSQSKIQSGKTLFDVFHHDVVKTWVQDTPIINIGASTTRVCRGGTTGANTFSVLASSAVNTDVGFRPCFEWNEF